MEPKIRTCNDKREVEKFRASNNWFQRFKPGHNIVLWRRSNITEESGNNRRVAIQAFHGNPLCI